MDALAWMDSYTELVAVARRSGDPWLAVCWKCPHVVPFTTREARNAWAREHAALSRHEVERFNSHQGIPGSEGVERPERRVGRAKATGGG